MPPSCHRQEPFVPFVIVIVVVIVENPANTEREPTDKKRELALVTGLSPSCIANQIGRGDS